LSKKFGDPCVQQNIWHKGDAATRVQDFMLLTELNTGTWRDSKIPEMKQTLCRKPQLRIYFIIIQGSTKLGLKVAVVIKFFMVATNICR